MVCASALVVTCLPNTARAINNGEPTGPNVNQAVVHLLASVPGPSNDKRGTGVLITPRWVLTSRHMFAGGAGECVPFFVDLPVHIGVDGVEAEIRFHPGPDPEAAVPDGHPALFYQGVGNDGDIRLLNNDDSPVDFCDRASMATDLALIRLDRRVPSTVASPMLPPLLGYPACPPSGFSGVIVGYGARSIYDDIFGVFWGEMLRARGVDDGFVHAWVGAGALYENSTLLPFVSPVPLPTPFSAPMVVDLDYLYWGIMRGDSGGPLYQSGPLRPLCGIASGTRLAMHFWPLPPTYTYSIVQEHAALNSQLAQDFLVDNVVVNGRLDAYCYEDPFNDTDTDQDGWPDVCDNCPDVPNDVQADWDHDTVGDACDLCPGKDDLIDDDGDGCRDCIERCTGPGNEGLGWNGCWDFDACGDADHDGVCNRDDNCLCQPNTAQSNCNVLSEEAQGMFIPNVNELGNHCDPVPCPWAEVIPSSKPCDVPVWPSCTETIRYHMAVRALRSHPAPDAGLVSACPVPGVRTLARFCQDQLDHDIECSRPDQIGDWQLDYATCWDTGSDCLNNEQAGVPTTKSTEANYHFYHRVTFSSAGESNGPDPDGEPAEIDYDHYAGDLSAGNYWTWRFENDFDRWLVHPERIFYGPVSDPQEIQGTLWLHAATYVGAGSAQCQQTGYHGPELANYHEHGLQPYEEQIGGVEPIRAIEYPFFLFLTLPDPGPEDYRRFDAIRGEASYLVSLGDGEWGALVMDGRFAEVLTHRFGQNLLVRAADPTLAWANAVEPYRHVGASPEFPMAVALPAEGGSMIVDTVVTDGTFFMATGDALPCGVDSPQCFDCPSGRCVIPGVCCELPCTSDDDCPSGYCRPDMGICSWLPQQGSPHVRDFAAVLTRIGRGLYVVGGDDLATGEPSGEIWFTQIGAAGWRLVPAQIQVERVLAATYTWTTDELVVLDETQSGEARLYAVEVVTGATRMLGSWPRHRAWDHQWLGLDRDGAVLLASSTRVKKKEHAIARLDLRHPSGVWVDGIARGHRAFALPLLVDGMGYTLVLQQGQGNGKVKRVRQHLLELEPAALGDIGAQL